MGIFSGSKPYTAVSTETSAILSEGPDKTASTFLNLVQLLQMSDTSVAECGRVIRKALKHGTTSEQQHALALLESLVDNGVRTHALVVTSGVSEQLILLASTYTASRRASLSSGARVARNAHRLLSAWSQRNDPNIAPLYAKAGFKDKHSSLSARHLSTEHPDGDLDSSLFAKDGSSGSPFDDPEPIQDLSLGSPRRTSRRLDDDDASRSRSSDLPRDSRRPPPRPDRQRRHRSTHPDDDLDDDLYSSSRSRTLESGSSDEFNESRSSVDSKRQSFSFFRRSRRAEKRLSNESSPKSASIDGSSTNLRAESITSTIATAHNTATRLVNAVIMDASSKDAHAYYRQAKQVRKRVLDLISTGGADTQEFVGQLLAANEELIGALQSYDAVIVHGDSIEAANDHEQPDVPLARTTPIEPLRAPPSPPRARAAAEEANPFGDQPEGQHSVPIYN